MKKLIYKTIKSCTIVLLIINICSCSTQTVPTDNIPPRIIEVTGSAEMQIEPDIVKLEIILSTTKNNDKKNAFYKILTKNGVKEENISIESMNQYNWWWYYHNNYNHTEQKYTVTIDADVDAVKLMTDLKQVWIKSISISEKTNTKLQDYRKEIKIEAVKAAKEKATYLLAALDEEISTVISVTEINGDINTNSNDWWYQSNQVSVSNSTMSSSSQNQASVNGMSMDKIRYEVKIIFSIK